MANEIKVPVRLEVILDSVSLLKSILANLEPKSTGWKELSKYIQSMEKEALNLQSIMSKPFGSEALFGLAEKSINKVDLALSRAALTMQKLNFSDLKLDANLKAELSKIQLEFKDIENEITNFKARLKENLKLDDIWDSLEKVDPNALTHSFDLIVKTVESKVRTLDAEVKKAKIAMDNLALTEKQALLNEKFLGEKTLKDRLDADIFNQFFQKSAKSFQFKSGQKAPFYEWVKNNILLNDALFKEIENLSATKLEEQLASMDFSKILNSVSGAKDRAATGRTNYNNSLAQFELAKAVLLVLGLELEKVDSKTQEMGAGTKTAEGHLREFLERLAEAARNSSTFEKALTNLRSGLDLLRNTLSNANSEFLRTQRVMSNFSQIKMAIVNFMGFRQTLNLVKSAISGALNHIKELDSVMNKISIVTDMSTADLWNLVDSYSKMAQAYGVSIKGAYEVSQIYYQQGLKTNDVLTLTNETLKLAKISGLDYSKTTDYMTTALRGFKMEMSDASKIVDVYSNLAAHTAVSSEELAVAMSKTASSMESVGSTFQETSAMIGTMVAVTRESSTNIGTALKSIASRYGEMKKDMSAVIDAEGEAISYNKVDAALQSIGISMKTADGQFREFTDVIIELGEKWDELDSIQQRYIATLFAGNRQQSRFLALVSNVDLLKRNIAVAEDSEDTGTLQALKALDSVESKLEQLKVSYQQFYTTVGGETIWKGMLDGARGFVDYLNGLPKLFGKIPVSAIAVIANALGLVKMLAEQAIGWIADTWSERLNKNAEKSGDEMGESMSESMRGQVNKMYDVGRELGKAASKGFQEGAAEGANLATSTLINAAVNKGGDVGATVAQQLALKKISTTSSVDSQIATLDAMKSTVKDWFTGTFSDVDLDSGKDAIVANMTAAAANASSDLKPALSGVGTDVSISIAQGILQSMGMTADAAKELSTTILNTIRSTLNIHSPSPTVIAMLKTGIGGATVQALAEAGADAGESAEAFGERLMLALADSIKNGEANIKNLMSALGDNFDELFKELSPHLTLTLRDDGLTEELYKTFLERYEKNKAQFNETTRPINARGKLVEAEILQLEEEAEALRQEKIREANAAHNSARALHYESGMQDFNSLLPEEKYIQLQDLKNERAELLRQKHDAANLARSIRDLILAEERATIQANSELISKLAEFLSQAATQSTENKIPTTIKDNILPAVELAAEIGTNIGDNIVDNVIAAMKAKASELLGESLELLTTVNGIIDKSMPRALELRPDVADRPQALDKLLSKFISVAAEDLSDTPTRIGATTSIIHNALAAEYNKIPTEESIIADILKQYDVPFHNTTKVRTEALDLTGREANLVAERKLLLDSKMPEDKVRIKEIDAEIESIYARSRQLLSRYSPTGQTYRTREGVEWEYLPKEAKQSYDERVAQAKALLDALRAKEAERIELAKNVASNAIELLKPKTTPVDETTIRDANTEATNKLTEALDKLKTAEQEVADGAEKVTSAYHTDSTEVDNLIAKWERFLQLRQEIQAAGKKSSMKDLVAEWKVERDALAAELGVSKSMPTKDIQDIISGKVPLPAQLMSLDTTTGPLQDTTTAANEAKEAILELTAAEKEEVAVTPTSSDADAYKETAAAAEETVESLKELTTEKRTLYLNPSSEGNPNLEKWFADVRALLAEGAKASTEGIIGPSRDFAQTLSMYNSTLTIPGTFAKEPPAMGFAGMDILSGAVKIPVRLTITEQLAAAILKSLDSGEIDGNLLIHTLNDHLLALAKAAVLALYNVRPGDKYDQTYADVKRESYIGNAAWTRDLTSRLTIPEDTDIRHKRYAIELGYERQLSNLLQEAKGAPILQYKLDSLNDWRNRELGMLDPDKAYDLALEQVERLIKNEDRYVPERRTSADAAFAAIEAVRAREEAAAATTAEEAPASYLTDDLYPAHATNAILEEVEAREADAAAAKEQAQAVQEANKATEESQLAALAVQVTDADRQAFYGYVRETYKAGLMGPKAPTDATGLTHSPNYWIAAGGYNTKNWEFFERAKMNASPGALEYIREYLANDRLTAQQGALKSKYDASVVEEASKVMAIVGDTNFGRETSFFGRTNVANGTRSFTSAIRDLMQAEGSNMIGSNLYARGLTPEVVEVLEAELKQRLLNAAAIRQQVAEELQLNATKQEEVAKSNQVAEATTEETKTRTGISEEKLREIAAALARQDRYRVLSEKRDKALRENAREIVAADDASHKLRNIRRRGEFKELAELLRLKNVEINDTYNAKMGAIGFTADDAELAKQAKGLSIDDRRIYNLMLAEEYAKLVLTETQAPVADETAKHEANTEAIKLETEAVKELNAAKQEAAGGGGNPPLTLDPSLDVIGHLESGRPIAPELGTSLNEIISLNTGDVLGKEDVVQLLNELLNVGVIAEDTKTKLLELYETRPTEEFIDAYSLATATNGSIADANTPIELASSNYRAVNLLEFNLDNLGPDNLLLAPVKLDTEEAIELASTAREEIEGQLTFDDIKVEIKPEVKPEAVEEAVDLATPKKPLTVKEAQANLEAAKQAYANKLDYTYDSESDKYVPNQATNGMAYSPEEYAAKLQELKAAAELAKVALDEALLADRPTLVANALALIDKLVETEAITPEIGASLTASMNSKSTEELIQFLKELLELLRLTGNTGLEAGNKVDEGMKKANKNSGQMWSAIGMGITTLSSTLGGLVGQTTELGGAISSLGTIAGGASRIIGGIMSHSPMGWIMGITTAITGIISFFQNFSLEKQIERAEKKFEELNNKAKEIKANFKILDKGIDKYNELAKKRYESEDAEEEYLAHVDELTSKFPELLLGFDSAGNAIMDTKNMEDVLTAAREDSAAATLEAVKAERESAKLKAKLATLNLDEELGKIKFSNEDLAAKRGEAAAVVALNRDPEDWLHFYENGVGRMFLIYDNDAYQSASAYMADAEGMRGLFGQLAWLASTKDASIANYADLAWANLATSEAFLSAYDELNGFDLSKFLTNLAAMDNLSVEEDLMLKYLNTLLGTPAELMADINSDILSNEADLKTIANKELFKFLTEDNTFETDVDAMNGILAKMRESSLSGDTEAVNKYYTWLQEFVNSLPEGSDILEYASELLDAIDKQLAPVVRQFNAALNEKLAATRKEISSTLNSSKYLSTETRDSASMMGLLTEYLEAGIGDNEDVTQYLDNNKDIISQLDNYWISLASKYNDEGENLQEKLISMLADGEHYSAEDIIRELNLPEDDDIAKLFLSVFGESDKYDSIIKNITEKYKGKDKTRTNLDNLEELITAYWDNGLNALTSIDRAFYSIIANRMKDLEKAGQGTKSDTLLAATDTLRTELDKLDEETRNIILDSLKENGIATKEAIAKTKLKAKSAGVEDNDAVYKALEALEATTSMNIKLSMQALTDDFSSNWSDSSKNLKKLTSGIDFTEMLDILDEAETFGGDFTLTRDDFIQNGDKLVLTAEKASEYWKAFIEYNRALAKEYEDAFIDAERVVSNSVVNQAGIGEAQLYSTLKSLQGFDAISTIMGDELENYLVRDKDTGEILNYTNLAELRERLFKKIEDDRDSIDKYKDYLDWADKQIDKAHQWDTGNYSSLMSDMGANYATRLAELARGAQYTTPELNAPDVKNAVDKIQSAYGSFISDLIEKGADKINLDAYKGIFNTDIEAIKGLLASGSTEEIIRAYAMNAGKTLEEVDGLLSQYVSKTTSKYTGIIEELMSYTGGEVTEVTREALGLDADTQVVSMNAAFVISKAKEFLQTLAEQIGKAGYKLSDYNATAKSILDKTLFNLGGNSKALLDFASGDIGADALETLANNFGLQLDLLVNVETGQVLGVIGNRLSYNAASGNYEIQGTFDGFIAALENQFGITIDRTSKQYVESFKAFNDAKITKEHEIDKAVTEELKGIISLKPGESLNIALTFTTLSSTMTGLFEMSDFKAALEEMGANLVDGILTIELGADIQGIIQAIALKAAEAGALLPEELDELNDALVLALRDITNIISSGIGGSISGELKRTLTKWVADYGVTDLQFIETAEGYQLATESAKELYHTINAINSLLGQVVFEKLKDNLIETDERFKSINSTTGYIRELETKGVSTSDLETLSKLNGNVDMFNRPVLQNEDGTISTILAATEESRNYESDLNWVMNITPITPAGEKLEDKDLYKYIQDLVDKSGGKMDEMIKLDKAQLGLIIEGENVELKNLEEIVKQYDLRAEKLHLIGEAIEKNKLASAEELALAQKMNEVRGLTEDDSFKFMDQDIPSGLKNPLNYFESWNKAYQAMKATTTGGKSQKGKMAYQDFYNLITEMGNLEKITGKSILIGKNVKVNSENVASLIELAAGALEVQSDGSLKVNLSKIGVDFAAGADAMNTNVAGGIKEVAASQVQMLDLLIGLLETIVTMEDAFKQFNVDADMDMELDFDEIFKVKKGDDGSIQEILGFADNWLNALEYLRKKLDPKDKENYSEDFARGAESIQFAINGFLMSLADLLNTNFADLSKYGFTEENFNVYQAIMQGVYDAIQSGDYSELNIKELIMEKLSKSLGEGGKVTFDMGNYTFIGTGSGTMNIDWDTKAAKDALTRHTKEEITKAATEMLNGNAEVSDIQMVLETKGTVYLKDNKWTVKGPDNKEYSEGQAGYEEALSAAVLKDVKDVKDVKMEMGTGKATGTLLSGEMVFTVTSSKGQITYTSEDGSITGTSPLDVVNLIVDKQYNEWEDHNELASEEEKTAKRVTLLYAAEVKAGISSFELNSQSYLTIEQKSRDKLEAALRSGNAAEIEIAINADPKLASLKGLSSSEIEEKLGIKEVPIKINGNVEEANTKLEELQKKVKDITDPTYTIDINLSPTVVATYATLSSINLQLESIANNKTLTIDITKNVTINETTNSGNTSSSNKSQSRMTGALEATGNFAMAQGTLMGELGQELVVSNGRYFVVGQNGPEFVDLADDAIVFNHLQTEQLLKHGMSNTRGKAVTSEQNAVAFAKGSLAGGPALASARAVLAQLKQLRAMWKSLGNTSAQDLAGLGGSGGGGGGGDKGNGVESAWIKAVERWYNLMQEIAKLEKLITHEEQLRTKLSSDWLKNGAAYYLSLKKSLLNIEKLMIAQEQLNIEQRDYYNQRVKLLSETPFGKLYGFNEGQLEYKLGTLSFLSDLMARDDYGATKYTAEEQYNLLVAKGFGDYMKYDSSGKAIVKEVTEETASGSKGVSNESNFYASSVLAFWDLVESLKTEMLNLYDTISTGEDKMLELEADRNEILEEIRNNQIEVENSVLEAFVNERQELIDNLSDERKALEESTNKYISGLTDALNKEKEMYLTLLDEEELNRKRRLLAILQRSGGSASLIDSLQRDIRSAELDQYFNYQQQLIDKIQEASDLEIERLDTQINIMTESLEYLKEHGLLWNEVYDYMYNHSAYDIAAFIQEHDLERWGASPLETEKLILEELFKAQQWEAFLQDLAAYNDYMLSENGYQLTVADAVYGDTSHSDWNVFNTAMTKLYGDLWKAIAGTYLNKFFRDYSSTGDITQATTSLTSSLSNLGSQLTSSIGGAFNSLKAEIAEAKALNSSGGGGGGSSGGSGSSGGTGGSNNNNNNNKKSTTTTTEWAAYATFYKGSGASETLHATGTGSNAGEALAAAYSALMKKQPPNAVSMGSVRYEKRYKLGGLADFTGLAKMDGTKSKPEAVLNAHQTKVLRDDILGNKPTSLVNLLLDFKDVYEGIGSNYSTTNNDSGITIENATVEMHVEQISNDYDARRAGELALSEMMRIARKTSAKNSVGR